MAVKKSRQYSVDGNSYAFDFVSEKLAGIKKSVNGVLNSIPPKGSEFASVSSSDEALDAYRIAKYGSNKTAAAKETSIAKLSDEELLSVITKVVKYTKAESIRDMGKVMKVLKEDYGDQCDFQKASKLVKESLSNNTNKNN